MLKLNSFFVFTKKELLELTRTKKLYIFIGIFALFGMVSPVLARYMQEIVVAAMGSNVPLVMPPTTWIDSYSQLYSNLTQMGGLCVIFIFMGCVVGEKQSGSAALTLTKNLTHARFIMAKFTVSSAVLIASVVSAIILCYLYTYYLFETAGELQNVLMGALSYCIFMLLLVSVTVLSSTIAKSTAVSALLSFCGFILLSVSNYIPKIGAYLPGTLLSKAMELTTGTSSENVVWAIVISICIIVVCLFVSVRILKKQEI